MFKLKTFYYLFALISVVLSEDDIEEEEDVNKIETLCERPIINAADRMVNNTVRLYRGQYYWTLNGLPAESGTLDGPYDLPFKKMGSIFRNNTVVTLLGGTDRGKTVKTEDKKYWLWDDKGNMKTESSGVSHNRFPRGGFEAAIHDGNLDDPTLIGFKGIKSYYFSTRYRVWTIDNKPSGYFGGKYNESFPTDLSAAFTLPADDPKDVYIAYFFKRDKYCKRPKILKSGKDCDQWLPNKDLFGCDQQPRERTHANARGPVSPSVEQQSSSVSLQALDLVEPGHSTVNSQSSSLSLMSTLTQSGSDQQNSKSDSKAIPTEKALPATEQRQGNPTTSTLKTTSNGSSLSSNVLLAITYVLTAIKICFHFF